MAYEERVTVTVTPDGMIEVNSAVQAMGQGIATSLAQLAVDVFQVPIDRIRVVMGDTDRNNGFGSAGSRSLFIGGSAVHVASQKTIDEAKTMAAEALEAPAADIEYKAGRFNVTGTDLGIGLFELAGQAEGRAHLRRREEHGRRPELAQRLPRVRGGDRSRHRQGRRGGVFVGQRHRPRREPADRARPGRRRRGAGHRPGAVRAGGRTTPRPARR